MMDWRCFPAGRIYPEPGEKIHEQLQSQAIYRLLKQANFWICLTNHIYSSMWIIRNVWSPWMMVMDYKTSLISPPFSVCHEQKTGLVHDLLRPWKLDESETIAHWHFERSLGRCCPLLRKATDESRARPNFHVEAPANVCSLGRLTLWPVWNLCESYLHELSQLFWEIYGPTWNLCTFRRGRIWKNVTFGF